MYGLAAHSVPPINEFWWPLSPCPCAGWRSTRTWVDEHQGLLLHGTSTLGSLLARLAARILWRIEREGGGLSENCLVSIDDLQNHVESFDEEEKKDLRVDVESFLEFWPAQSQQFGMQYISHIFGVVCQRGEKAKGASINAMDYAMCPREVSDQNELRIPDFILEIAKTSILFRWFEYCHICHMHRFCTDTEKSEAQPGQDLQSA